MRVFVRRFETVGNTILSDQGRAEVMAPYQDRIITSEELQYVRYLLTEYYLDRGYINSGVVIPEQQVMDGIIRLQIVEGQLNEIEVSGNERLRSRYVSTRLESGREEVLNVQILRKRLVRLQQSDVIQRINADLQPGVLTKLLGRPFSFYEGVQDGRSKVSVIHLSQNWLRRGRRQVLAARSTINLGVDALGVTINERGPDGRFCSWLGQLQWAQRIGSENHQLNFRTDMQLSADPLLPLEQCAIGGADTVRGYRVNQLVRDNCFVASLEYRIPIFRLPIPKLSRGPADGIIQLAPFADLGVAWNTDRPSLGPNTLPSLGMGLRWDPSPKFHADVYWGYAFQDFVVQGDDLQDDGVSFRVVVDVL